MFPHGPGRTSLYDDAGEGLGYQHGAVRVDARRATSSAGTRRCGSGPPGAPTRGSRRLATTRAVFVDVTRPRHVTIDGAKAAFTYDAATHTLSVPVPGVGARPARARPCTTAARSPSPPQPGGDVHARRARRAAVAGSPGRVVATVTNHGPGAVRDVSVAIPAPAGWTVVATSADDARGALAPDATFHVNFTVTPAGTASNAEMVATADYRNPDGIAVHRCRPRSPSSPARSPSPSASASPPACHRATPSIVPGNIDQLGPWDPGKLAHDRPGRRHLGGDDHRPRRHRDPVQVHARKLGDGRGVGRHHRLHQPQRHRQRRAPTPRCSSTTPRPPGTTRRSRTSTRPSRYWRDPVVVSTSPADGSTGAAPAAVTVTFQTDVNPTGADFSSAVTVTRDGAPSPAAWPRRRRAC